MKIEHDFFSLAAILEYFEPERPVFNYLWADVIKFVKEGNLNQAITLLNSNEHFLLKPFKPISTSSTGTPPKEKKKQGVPLI
jgi:hypothetical protein